MKKIKILFTISLLVSIAYGQVELTSPITLVSPGTTVPFLGSIFSVHGGGSYIDLSQNVDVVSKYDTTVLFKGIDTISHVHNYLSKSNKPHSNYSCAVMHGPSGCPNDWMNENIICSICLRNCNVVETRTEVKRVDQYQIAKDRLDKILKK